MPSKDVGSLSAQELRTELSAFSIADYKWTLLACTLAVPLGLRLPTRQKYAPLLVLGTVGSLADWFAAEARLTPYRQRLAELEAADKGHNGQRNSGSVGSGSASLQ
jgi:hypothetical protein